MVEFLFQALQWRLNIPPLHPVVAVCSAAVLMEVLEEASGLVQ